MMATSSPPGPILQWINRFLHQDPVDKIAYAIYWCLFLAILSPVAILVLQVQVAIQLLVHLGNWNGRNACHPATKDSDNTAHRLAVVITGCDCGFGREIALKCADAGFVVFAGCLSVDGVGQLQDSPNIIALKMDVTNDNEVNAAVKTVSEWLKGNDDGDESTGRRESRSLHALINNAGVGAGGEVDWIDLSDFQWCIDVNYIGMVRCCKAFLPLFKEQAFNKTYEYARIFNLSSMAGMISGSPGLAAYHASKHAAVAFSTCLRIELKAFGIQVTTINPSYHNTPLTNTMYLRADRMWETLSPRLKAEYGQAFFNRWRYLAVDVPHKLTWKIDVCVDQVLQHVTSRRAPAEVLIGTDARFIFPVLRMVPAWCADMLMTLQRRPIPAAMMEREKQD